MGRRTDPRRRRVLRQLGIERLTEPQDRAVAAVLAGRDTVLVMPTGGGKSAVYQVAGGLSGGPVVVVVDEARGRARPTGAVLVTVPAGSVEQVAPRRVLVHRTWGEGSVVREEGDVLTVLFPSVGSRTLSASLLDAEGLLEPS